MALLLGPLLSDAFPGTPEFEAAAEGLSTQCAKVATPSPQSLTGHTSPVESVRLNTPEELIVAGSQSGSIRVWDLEAAKSRHLHLSSPRRCCLGLFCPATSSGKPTLTRLGAFPPGALTRQCDDLPHTGSNDTHCCLGAGTEEVPSKCLNGQLCGWMSVWIQDLEGHQVPLGAT